MLDSASYPVADNSSRGATDGWGDVPKTETSRGSCACFLHVAEGRDAQHGVKHQ